MYYIYYYNKLIKSTPDEAEAERFICDNGGHPYHIIFETQE